MENHDLNENNKWYSWKRIIKPRKPKQNPIDTILRRLHLQGKNSNRKTLNQSFLALREAKGVYNGPSYLREALETTQPFFKLGKVKRSGRTLKVPYPIRYQRSQKLSLNGLCNTLKTVKGPQKRETLRQEIIGIQEGNRKSVAYETYLQYKKNLQLHKKNIRYRW